MNLCQGRDGVHNGKRYRIYVFNTEDRYRQDCLEHFVQGFEIPSAGSTSSSGVQDDSRPKSLAWGLFQKLYFFYPDGDSVRWEVDKGFPLGREKTDPFIQPGSKDHNRIIEVMADSMNQRNMLYVYVMEKNEEQDPQTGVLTEYQKVVYYAMLGLQDLTSQATSKPVGMGVWKVQAAKEAHHQDLCPGTMGYLFDILLELRLHREYNYIEKLLILDASWSYFTAKEPYGPVDPADHRKWKEMTASLRKRLRQLDDPAISNERKVQIRGEILEHEKTPGRNCYMSALLSGNPNFQNLVRMIAREDKYIATYDGVNYPPMSAVGS